MLNSFYYTVRSLCFLPCRNRKHWLAHATILCNSETECVNTRASSTGNLAQLRCDPTCALLFFFYARSNLFTLCVVGCQVDVAFFLNVGVHVDSVRGRALTSLVLCFRTCTVVVSNPFSPSQRNRGRLQQRFVWRGRRPHLPRGAMRR